jgi:hypothetical protein
MNTEEQGQPKGLPPEGFALGGVGEGGFDTSLGAQPVPDGLSLPRGALIAVRKSGGQRFSSREIVVYRNGVAMYRTLAQGSREREGIAHLNEAEMARLDRLIRRARLLRQTTPGRPDPDGFSYEVVARLGNRLRACEFSSVNVAVQRERLITFLFDHVP